MKSRDTERTLLAVDDEDGVNSAIRDTLEPFGYRVLETTDPWRALEIVRGQPPDLLIIDLFMPLMDGATLLQQCRLLHPGLPVLLTTGLASQEELRRWRARGETIIAKPWLDEELAMAVKQAFERADSAVR